jgi:hypothetical protein
MKKLLNALVLVILSISAQSQTDNGDANNEDYFILKNETATFSLNDNNTNYAPKYSISKIDNKTKKNVFNVFLNIPDKDKNEVAYTTGNNKISTFVVDNDIQIIYDVYDKKADKKKCYIKTLGIKGSPLSEATLLSETECKSRFSIANTVYRVIYSPDKSKFALLLDNYSKGIVIEPSITIFDSKKFTVLSTKKLKSMYNGNKAQIDPYNNFKIDNGGNIILMFTTHNAETNMVIKSYQGDIPFKDNDIKNIKDISETPTENTSGEAGKYEEGRFYNSLQDYANNKPMGDFKIKNGSHSIGYGGETFKLIDKNGAVEKEKLSKFPTTLFTYRGEYDTDFDLYRVFESDVYKIITVGNICVYTQRHTTGNGGEKDVLYWSEGGINGEIKKFKEGALEDLLEKAGLLEAYKKDNPKREFKDDKSDFYTKEVSRYIKYIDILNKKK